ncbi:hypothetical protein [Brevibacillus laterosporus]|uniref:hypothetical protein n=1 Tax=Brevibacillus laterosporus TaxID=1465 RepID=UPI001EF37B46|nr:hypothetical protein [Brevibacillus laterosporus]MCG7319774.1 hypothetical protein [Brevibacillus laterosporus]
MPLVLDIETDKGLTPAQISMEKEFWNAMMKEETTMDRMLADEIILVLKTQWKVSDAMGMKEQVKYLGELADRVRIASGQEPQNK